MKGSADVITAVRDLPPDLEGLVELSLTENFRAVRTLAEDWKSGSNRFDQRGEFLLVARTGPTLVGVCGLNRDPYSSDPTVGRVRHLYVAPAFRRQGIARRLVGRVVDHARLHFRRLRLRTHSAEADAFYCAIGFRRTNGEADCTHEFVGMLGRGRHLTGQ